VSRIKCLLPNQPSYLIHYVHIPYIVEMEVIEERGPRKIILDNVTRGSRRGTGKGQSARLENE
jgi:hypothetical protein